MSSTTLCRLCRCTFHNCKELVNKNGQCSEAYDIVCKYFDPMLLIPGQELNPPVICLNCWQQIHDFYYFQQSVLEAHSNLEDVKEILPVKAEVEQIDDNIISQADVEQIDDNIISQNYDVLNKELKNEKSSFGMETFDSVENNTFSSEDERPLKESFELVKEKFVVKRKPKKTVLYHEGKSKSAKKREKLLISKNETKQKSELLNDSKLSDNEKDTSDVSEKTEYQQKTLERDAFISAWKKELDCVKCNGSFANFSLLRKHFFEEHSDQNCYIICCDRKFQSRYHIVEHIRLHMDPNAYKCDICGRCSTNSRNLARHIKYVHTDEGKQRSSECPICFKTLANKRSLRFHMEIHKKNLTHICKECGKGFASKQKRTLHERFVHNSARICGQCGKTVHNAFAMRQHLRLHAGVEKIKWPCDLCNAELYSPSELRRHKLLVHQDSSTVYVCSDCGKVAATEIALLIHKKNMHQ